VHFDTFFASTIMPNYIQLACYFFWIVCRGRYICIKSWES